MGSTFSYESKRKTFITNAKQPISSANKIWMGSMSSGPASRRKCYPASRWSRLYKSLLRGGAGLPQPEDCRSAGAAYPSPLTGSRPRPHPTLRVGLLYVEWHMRQLLAPILFDDDDKPQALAARTSIVAPAQRSTAAKLKAFTEQTADGMKVHSFQTLIGDLATIVKNRIQPADKNVRRLRYAHSANSDSAARVGFARRLCSALIFPGCRQ